MFGLKNGLCIAVFAAAFLAMATPATAQSQRGVTGACCLPDGSCQQSGPGGCEKDGGQYQGDGTSCDDRGGGSFQCEPFGPPNARCADAIELTIGVPMQGTVDGAYQPNDEACIETSRGGGPVGVWFSVIGNGNELKASICGLDPVQAESRGGTSYLYVYCRDCVEPVCLDGDTRRLGSCDLRGNSPEVFFCTEPGTEYLIFVALEDEPYLDFEIRVDDRSVSCETDRCGPANDECEDAIAIMTLDEPVLGSTMNALSDEVPQCVPVPGRGDGTFFPNGVWYSVTGTGNTMSAEICVPLQRDESRGPGPQIPFEGLIQVFCGDCEGLACVTGVYGLLDDCAFRGGLSAEWCSEPGREYLILVSLEELKGGGSDRGINPFFLLNVRDEGKSCEASACGLPNDDCEDAIMLNLGDEPVFGTSEGANPDNNAGSCFIRTDRGGPAGVWYKVIGTGTELALELCVPERGAQGRGVVEMAAGVFCGGCNNLQCIESDFLFVPFCDVAKPERGADTLYWCSEEGRVYYIFVESFGFETRGGDEDFLISVRDTGINKCEPEQCGVEQEDFCEDAQLVCPGQTYFGHTFDATSDYLDHGGSFDTIFFCGMFFGVYDVWYKYIPAEDGLLFVHIEGPPTEYVFGVYDDCRGLPEDLLACNIARHHGVIVFWVNAYETYYIRAAGTYFSRGEFELDLVAPPCANGIPTVDWDDRPGRPFVTLPR